MGASEFLPNMHPHVAVGMYATRKEATEGLRALIASGFPEDRISILARDDRQVELVLSGVKGAYRVVQESPVSLAQETEATGFVELRDMAVGGGVALLAGMSALALPGLGAYLLAAGPLALIAQGLIVSVAGVGLGAVLGAILDERGSEAQRERYERAIIAGSWLLVAHGTHAEVTLASQFLRASPASDVEVF
jgi:hypothetical protein